MTEASLEQNMAAARHEHLVPGVQPTTSARLAVVATSAEAVVPRLPGSLDPVPVVRGCQMCIRAGGEHVSGDAPESAGLVVGDDSPVVVPCRQGDLAEFVQGEDLRAGNVPDALQWGTGCDLDDC